MMEMHRVTVVIESATQVIAHGMPFAGGRVVNAMQGDKLEELERHNERLRRTQEERKGKRFGGLIPAMPGKPV